MAPSIDAPPGSESLPVTAAPVIDRFFPESGRWRGAVRQPWLLTLFGVLIVPLVLTVGITAMAPTTTDPSTARLVSADVLERDYGVRFDMVGVTASGGLLDVRFSVLDAEKAKHLFHDTTTSPELYVEQSGAVLRRRGMSHGLTFLSGGRYFVLFSNAGGVVQSGTRVSVVIDDVRLEPMAATS
jgi:hypothetical protein